MAADLGHQAAAQPQLVQRGCQFGRRLRHLQRLIGLPLRQAARHSLDDAACAPLQRCPHAFGEIRDFGAELDRQAALIGIAAGLGIKPVLPVPHQPLSGRIAPAQQDIELCMVTGEIPGEQGVAEGFLGREVVIERAFGNFGGRQQLGQPDRREALFQHQGLGDVEHVLTQIGRSNGGSHGRMMT